MMFAKWIYNMLGRKKELLIAVCVLIGGIVSAQDSSILFSASPFTGGVTYPSGFHYFHSGQIYTIYAAPKEGYIFGYWMSVGSVEFLSSLLDPHGLIKTHEGSSDIIAVFFPIQQKTTLTMAVSPTGGGVTTPSVGSHQVSVGGSVDISASAATGYEFDHWQVAGSATLGEPLDPTTYVVCKGEATVTAVFTQETSATLTMVFEPENGGSTTPAVGTHDVAQSTPVQVVAQAATGYQFEQWRGSGAITIDDTQSPSTYVELKQNATLTAVFKQTTKTAVVTMGVSPDDSGMTTPAVGNVKVNVGEPVAIQAIANSGYSFWYWKATAPVQLGDYKDSSTTMTVVNSTSATIAVTACFKQNAKSATLTIDVSPAGAGTTNPGAGTYQYYAGQTINVEAIPATGYHFVSWGGTGGVNVMEPNLIKTFVEIEGDGGLTARFAENSRTVTLSLSSSPVSGGSTNPAGGAYNVDVGESFEIKAIPNDGFYFKRWLHDENVVIAAEYQVDTVAILSGDASVVALFEKATTTVTLNVVSSPTDGGSTSRAGTHQVNANQYYEVQATPAQGYYFVKWTGEGNVTIVAADLDTTQVVLTGNATLTANFAESAATATLTFAVSPAGSGYTNPGEGVHVYDVGRTIEILATPQDGYHFIEWNVDGDAVIANFSLMETVAEIKGSAVITAKFAANSTATILTLAVEGSGATLPAIGSYTVYVGETRRIVAMAGENQHFVNWSVSGNVEVLDTRLVSSYVVISGDGTVTANFSPNTQITELTMAVEPSGSGTVSPSAGTHEVNLFQPYAITATPAEGYYFSNWRANGKAMITDIDLLETTVVLWAQTTLTAVFKEATTPVVLTLAVSPAEGGNTSPSPGIHTISANQTFPIEALPADGYHFVNWSAEGSVTIDAPNIDKTTVVLTGDATVTANFTADTNPVVLTMAVSPEGSGTTNPGVGIYTVDVGETIHIEALPANGYHFVQWDIVGNGTIADVKTFKTTASIQRDSQIIAHFAANTGSAKVVVDILPKDGGATSPSSGDYEVIVGAVYMIEAIPADGYYFARWETTGNLVIEKPRSSKTSIATFGDSTLTAEFVPNQSAVTLTMGVIPSDAGVANPAFGKHIVSKDQNVEIEASAATGYYFVGWITAGSVVVENPSVSTTTATLKEDASVTAQFAPIDVQVDVTIAVSPDGGGTTVPSAGSYQYNERQPVVVKATANDGYVFSKWVTTGNIQVDDNRSSTTVATMNGDGTITATFNAKEDTVLLTLLVDNDEGGIVIPWAPTSVAKGEPVRIQEAPFDGFVFVDWVVNSGDAIITYSEQDGTVVTCESDATLTAKFAPVVTPTRTSLNIRYSRENDEGKEEKPKDSIHFKNGPMNLESFDPESDNVKVLMAGETFDLSNDEGAYTQISQGWQYDSNDGSIKLQLNFKKMTWSFDARKFLLVNPDFENGVVAVLIVNDQYFGANYQVSQKSSWTYTVKKNGPGQALSPNGTLNIDVIKANGSYFSSRKRPLNIRITQATLSSDSELTFDPTTDSVSIYIDNVFLPIPPNSFVETRDGVYEYNNKNRETKMKIDLNKKTWSLSIKESSGFKDITYKDGLDVYLVIGDVDGGTHFDISFKNTFQFR